MIFVSGELRENAQTKETENERTLREQQQFRPVESAEALQRSCRCELACLGQLAAGRVG